MPDEQLNQGAFYEKVVYVRMFGHFELENRIGSVVEEQARKPSLSWPLLKYLLVNRGREVDQEELLGTIWPERHGPEEENAARVRLNRLRAYLKPLGLDGRHGLVLYHNQKYILNPQYEICTDADCFDELMLQIRALPVNDPDGLHLCGRALELYRGPYLKYTKDDFWLDQIRESYSEEFHELVFNTVDRMLATGDDKLLRFLSSRVLDLLPSDLELHKAILNCYAHFGRDAERKRYTVQLMRTGLISDWLSSL